MLGFFLKGGIVMWPILGCSIIAGGIIMERFYSFHRVKLNLSELLLRIEDLIKKGKMEEALNFCQRAKGPLTGICALTLKSYKLPPERKEEILSQFSSREIRKMGKNLRILGIIGYISPLLGLFGTVVGMIKTFMVVENTGGVIDSKILAGGIWEALLTTAAGLTVAIPALIVYHYLEGRLEDLSSEMREIAFEVEELLRKRER